MNRIAALVAALLLTVATALFVFSYFDVAPTENWKEGSAASARDPWLAFSRGPGLDVHRYDSVEDIDLSEAGMVMADWSALSDEDPAPWASWVEGGGRLLLSFSNLDRWEGPWAEEAAFRGLGDVKILVPNRTEDTAKAGSATIDVDPLVRLSAPSGAIHYEASDGTAFVLKVVGGGWAASTGRPLALYNQGLAKPDNRVFAASLVSELKGSVWLPAPEAAPATKPESALGSPILALALLLLASLVFWRASPRLGPVLEAERFERPSLADRLLAEGRFLRRYKLLPKTTAKTKKEPR